MPRMFTSKSIHKLLITHLSIYFRRYQEGSDIMTHFTHKFNPNTNFESNWDGMEPKDRSLSLLRARLVQESRKIKQRQEKAEVTPKTTNEVL